MTYTRGPPLLTVTELQVVNASATPSLRARIGSGLLLAYVTPLPACARGDGRGPSVSAAAGPEGASFPWTEGKRVSRIK